MKVEETFIPLWPEEWHCLEPHLEGAVAPIGLTGRPGMMVFSCDDETHEKILNAAKKHCKHLVGHIESCKGNMRQPRILPRRGS